MAQQLVLKVRHNIWNRFQSLIGASSPTMGDILIGTVVSAAFNECVVEWPGGGQIPVMGAGTTGKRYFVFRRPDGSWRLDGELPDLPALGYPIEL